MTPTDLGSACTGMHSRWPATMAILVAVVTTLVPGSAYARARAAAAVDQARVSGAAAPQPTPTRAISTSTSAQRPFDHRRHERLLCRNCHGTGEQHRTLLVRTATDCARCHHDASRVGTCRDCHAPATLPEPGAVAVSLKLTVVDTARTRTLPFGHARHAQVACVECHGTPITLAPNRACASCHVEHHRAEANCSACHSTISRSVHPRHSHLSCSGTNCHASAVAPRPALSRNLCLTCHPEQRTHETPRPCAACHGIPLKEP